MNVKVAMRLAAVEVRAACKVRSLILRLHPITYSLDFRLAVYL